MKNDRLTLCIIGGYGTFGARIVELLAEAPVRIVVAGRSLEQAKALCGAHRDRAADLVPAMIDRCSPADVEDLFRHRPDIVVDASGPFQSYGERPYRLIEACLRHRTAYLDLADARDFVNGVSVYDDKAKAEGTWILTAASSFPVLTVAAIQAMSADLARLEKVWAGIAPSPYAGYGRNVIRAVASYAGQPVPVRRNGSREVARAFTETTPETIMPPGGQALGPRLFGLVDVPDHQLIPELWPEIQDVWIGVAPAPGILFRALVLASKGVARGWLPGLAPLAPALKLATDTLRWGEDRGGMLVSVLGRTTEGDLVQRRWHMIARGPDGPMIPAMAVAGLVRRCLEGETIEPGARSAAGELTLADYERMFEGRQITAGLTGEPLDAGRSAARRTSPDNRRSSVSVTGAEGGAAAPPPRRTAR